MKQQDFNQKIEELVAIGQNKAGKLTTEKSENFLVRTSLLLSRKVQFLQKLKNIMLLLL